VFVSILFVDCLQDGFCYLHGMSKLEDYICIYSVSWTRVSTWREGMGKCNIKHIRLLMNGYHHYTYFRFMYERILVSQIIDSNAVSSSIIPSPSYHLTLLRIPTSLQLRSRLYSYPPILIPPSLTTFKISYRPILELPGTTSRHTSSGTRSGSGRIDQLGECSAFIHWKS
jgi:hypothetical protein